MLKKILIFFICFLPFSLSAQKNLKDSSIAMNIVHADLAIGFPYADMGEQFGLHQSVGLGYQYKFKNNVLFGANATYFFGNTVKDTTIEMLYNSFGYVVGTDGTQFSPLLQEQAFQIRIEAGYITDVFSINPNSGLAFTGAIGLLQHNILIIADDEHVPQLNYSYKKGYDRLSNGISFSQFAGYYFFSNKQYLAFKAGIDITEALTKNRRSYNFDLQSADDELHLDILVSLKVSWNLSIYKNTQRKFYY